LSVFRLAALRLSLALPVENRPARERERSGSHEIGTLWVNARAMRER